MDCITARLTILFEDPYWVGVYERTEDDSLTAARIVFGAEPRDGVVYARLNAEWRSLRFSPPVQSAHRRSRPDNPKRRQRAARRETVPARPGTQAQQALAAQYEAAKTDRHVRTRQTRASEAERQFALRRQKHRDKHRGH